MTSGGREVDVGGALPINQLVCNSEFLTSEVEYCQSCEPQESWLSLECLTMKSSTLYERGPLPPYVHLASTRCHSRDRCSQAFPVFRTLVLPCIILNKNRRTKNRGGLGTRLLARGTHKWRENIIPTEFFLGMMGGGLMK